LREGPQGTVVTVKSKQEAHDLLMEAFPDAQQVRGIGSQDAAGIGLCPLIVQPLIKESDATQFHHRQIISRYFVVTRRDAAVPFWRPKHRSTTFDPTHH
jgi:hypothetical protein